MKKYATYAVVKDKMIRVWAGSTIEEARFNMKPREVLVTSLIDGKFSIYQIDLNKEEVEGYLVFDMESLGDPVASTNEGLNIRLEKEG